MSKMENYTKTGLRIKEEVFLKLKLLASIRDVTVTDIINEALEEYVKEHEEELKQKLTEIVK